MRKLARLPNAAELTSLEDELRRAVPPVGKRTMWKLTIARKATSVVGVVAGGFFAYMGIILAGMLLAERGALKAAVVVATVLGSAAYVVTDGSMRLIYRRMLVDELDGPRRLLAGSVGGSSSVAVTAAGDPLTTPTAETSPPEARERG